MVCVGVGVKRAEREIERIYATVVMNKKPMESVSVLRAEEARR